jgi:hypothetical protein
MIVFRKMQRAASISWDLNATVPQKIIQHPASHSIEWHDVVSLLEARSKRTATTRSRSGLVADYVLWRVHT